MGRASFRAWWWWDVDDGDDVGDVDDLNDGNDGDLGGKSREGSLTMLDTCLVEILLSLFTGVSTKTKRPTQIRWIPIEICIII